MWDKIWEIANSNVGILLLGSGVGFLFVRLVWEPYTRRKEDSSRQRTMREEASFRLLSAETQIWSGPRQFGISHQLEGQCDYVPSLNPIYRTWSLNGLVFAGWGKDIFDKCLPEIDRLKKATGPVYDTVQDKDEAQDAIDVLKKMLHI